ncbi:radical SAM protein [Candidatus Woesearchaeota archaeon]|jgi:anaerobic magnesium-protoporphyrin IX monomethyl ester cyclase|nr:radical SAM protein [Candidatus Woesearchaeota archaeon]
MIKKILLIMPPLRFETPPYFTYSLPILAASLEKEGFEVEILDLELHKTIINKRGLTRLICSKKFDIMGISGLITSYTTVQMLMDITRKQFPKKKIILGGGLASSVPEHSLKVMKADYVVYGEGVISTPNLIHALNNNKKLKNVKGICYMSKGKMIKTEPQPLVRNLDDLPRPAYHLMDMKKYINHYDKLSGFRKNMRIMTGVGCIGQCTYCFRICGKGSYRLYSIPRVIKEMKYFIKKYNIKHFNFIDEEFLVAKSRVIELCKQMRKHKINVTWKCCSRVDSINPEIVKTIKKAGCVIVGLGIESGSQKILDNMKKNVKVEQTKKALRILRKYNMPHGGTMMYGMVGENKETVKETIRFCREMEHDVEFFWTTPYPGTEIYNDLVKQGKIKDEKEFFEKLSDAYQFLINLTEFKTDEEAIYWKKYLQRKIKIPLYKKLYIRVRDKGLWNLDFQIYDFMKRRLFPEKYFESKYTTKKRAF